MGLGLQPHPHHLPALVTLVWPSGFSQPWQRGLSALALRPRRLMLFLPARFPRLPTFFADVHGSCHGSSPGIAPAVIGALFFS